MTSIFFILFCVLLLNPHAVPFLTLPKFSWKVLPETYLLKCRTCIQSLVSGLHPENKIFDVGKNNAKVRQRKSLKAYLNSNIIVTTANLRIFRISHEIHFSLRNKAFFIRKLKITLIIITVNCTPYYVNYVITFVQFSCFLHLIFVRNATLGKIIHVCSCYTPDLISFCHVLVKCLQGNNIIYQVGRLIYMFSSCTLLRHLHSARISCLVSS